jgi:hypothetical protein
MQCHIPAYHTGETKDIREMAFARANLSSRRDFEEYQYKVD